MTGTHHVAALLARLARHLQVDTTPKLCHVTGTNYSAYMMHSPLKPAGSRVHCNWRQELAYLVRRSAVGNSWQPWQPTKIYTPIHDADGTFQKEKLIGKLLRDLNRQLGHAAG